MDLVSRIHTVKKNQELVTLELGFADFGNELRGPELRMNDI